MGETARNENHVVRISEPPEYLTGAIPMIDCTLKADQRSMRFEYVSCACQDVRLRPLDIDFYYVDFFNVRQEIVQRHKRHHDRVSRFLPMDHGTVTGPVWIDEERYFS